MSNKTSIRSKLFSVAFGAGALVAASALVTAIGQGENTQYWVLALLGLALVVLFVGAKSVLAQIEQPVHQLLSVAKNMAEGKAPAETAPVIDNEIGSVIRIINEAQSEQQKKRQKESRQLDQMTRIKRGLDVVNTNVMIADAELCIIYMNASIQRMLRDREAEIQSHMPQFDAGSLIGKNIDIFHRNPNYQRKLLVGLNQAHKAKINVGSTAFSLIVHPISSNGERQGYIVEWQDLTDTLAQETKEAELESERNLLLEETLRIRKGLDVVNTNVMISDADLNIIYMNESIQRMLKHNEPEIQKQLPHFDADNLVGSNIDIFHENPDMQRNMLAALTDTHQTTLSIGNSIFDLEVNPIGTPDSRQGFVVEWKDLTDARALEAKEASMQEEQARLLEETQRIRKGLDVVNTNVMISDADLNIIYVNASIQEMLKHNEPEIQKQLPHFNASNLIGQNIDIFHENPSHQRKMLAGLTDTHSATLSIGDSTFALEVNPIGSPDNRQGFVVEWQDKTEVLRREAAEKVALEEQIALAEKNHRIRNALDNVSSNVMMADNDGKLIYVNKALKEMFRASQSQIQEVYPHFDVDNLIGQNFDSFHKEPSHQRKMVASLTSTHIAELSIAGRYFAFTANPIFNENNERLGTVVEWSDTTNEVMAQSEIADIVEGASRGDFNRRISTQGKEGFFKELASNLNNVMETTSDGLSELAKVLGAMSQGDLTQKIDKDFQGMFGQLKADANATIDQLTEIVTQIKESADAINTASSEIAAGNNDLSQRTEEQASSLEETAASMEQLTSTVQQNAENASQASNLAQGASRIAQKGGDVVNQVVSTMRTISDNSKQVEEIISVIDSIAFQTNILALNAAVEAARAGEQGRGFAVVATEVRNLAKRSAGAAKEIKELIVTSVDTVEEGSKLVDDAGMTMKDIVDAIGQVTTIMTEISAASAEQRSGIEQVNTAITQIDEVTQQNAALVEQAAAAAESSEEQARSLVGSVSLFKLGADSGFSKAPVASVTQSRIKSEPIQSPVKASQGVASAKPSVMNDDDDWEEF
ncbi:methyl-accepting chemotaxis protein [Oceanospirillum sediminis]|uniref:PAS domain-containing protein n=1 Tax=Oceanospirillum sediminis TaxID=2760088 RepID=A0A839IRK4_9GAMM|nr:methyl-accepting chemotaxis protein [Oceanospirillum sediminis]MBB1486836.1 PAS domain-containing protein [Oceanospirillum sediminis]